MEARGDRGGGQRGPGKAPPQSATDVEAQPTRAEQDLVSKFADPDLTVLVHRNQPLISEDSREPDPGSGPPGQEEAPPQSGSSKLTGIALLPMTVRDHCGQPGEAAEPET